MNAEMARITVASGVFNLVMLTLLTYEMGAVGAAISIVMTEIFVTSAMAWTIYAKRKVAFQGRLNVSLLEPNESLGKEVNEPLVGAPF